MMCTFRNIACAGLLALATVNVAHAFDPSSMTSGETATVDAFRFGTQAYQNGDKSTAFEALTYAASNGHMASQWKLGRMYADGDGVERDNGRAFDIFQKIVVRFGDARPGSVEARYVSNAFVKLSEFLTIGIDKKVQRDQGKAREFLYYAASYFRDPDAQYHLGLDYLGRNGASQDPKQAARWLNKAARKGHIMAQLQLGDLLLSGERIPRQPVNGLKWLTIARLLDGDNVDVRDRQEAAFALADSDTRRIAVSLAEDWVNGKGR